LSVKLDHGLHRRLAGERVENRAMLVNGAPQLLATLV
jgi:hypothetical protein